MNFAEPNSITEEEAELYDRQIRLWGANVQRSLRNTRVLVIGMKGVAAEVSKNLILSGVKSVTLMDPEKVVKDDLNSQYLLYPESVGENRAEASLKAAQVLNPNVKVTADTSDPFEKPVSYYSNFDVVCVTGQSPKGVVCLNEICKLYNVKFFCGDSFGMFGYLFQNLKVSKGNSAKVDESSISFRTALHLNWAPKTSLKKRKYEDPSYLVFKILTDFHTIHNRHPSRNSSCNDFQILLKLRKEILLKFNVEDDLLPVEYLENVLGEYGPTCSIIGGMIAQEVVKSLSNDFGSPYSMYLFNHLRCQLTGIELINGVASQSKENILPVTEGDVVELEV